VYALAPDPEPVRTSHDIPIEALGGGPFSVQSSAENEILDVIYRFFDAFAARDSTGMAAEVDMDGGLVITAFTPDGRPFVRAIEQWTFIPSLASREGPQVVETTWNPLVEVHDNLARFPTGTDDVPEQEPAWKIIAVADTLRREGCTDQGLRGQVGGR